MKILNKEIRKGIYWIAKSYPVYKEAVERYDKENGYMDENRMHLYQQNSRYIIAIEKTFKSTVNDALKEKVRRHFYEDKKCEPWEKREIKKEIEKWLYYLAKELGVLPVR